MSYRELRNFTEIMRALGYTRLISMENFRTPNFELVADILHWLVARYDPSIDISLEIATEEDRVLFLKGVVDAMNTKAQIKLNSKKLYSADGYAVKELLKISTLLYQSMRHQQGASGMNGQGQDDGLDMAVGVKPEDTKLMRNLASEVVTVGATMHDLLSREADLRDARTKSAARQLDTDEVERSIKMTIRSTNENVNTLSEKIDNLASDEANLDAKIEKKRSDLERSRTRLKSLQSVRPAFMDEYERLEGELKRLYGIYLERFRNVEYLENELEMHNREEQAKLEASDKVLKHMQDKIREEELALLREGKAGIQEADDDEFGLSAVDSLPLHHKATTQQPQQQQQVPPSNKSRNNGVINSNTTTNKNVSGSVGKVLGSMGGGNASDSDSLSESGSLSASSDIEGESDIYDPTVDDIDVDDDLSDDNEF